MLRAWRTDAAIGARDGGLLGWFSRLIVSCRTAVGRTAEAMQVLQYWVQCITSFACAFIVSEALDTYAL